MSALEKLQNEVERQKRKIEEIEKSIETVEKEFNVKFDDERKDIKEQKAFIDEPDLQIAIVGTIKAGKSTFINALFEENIASTDVTPETASLTKFRYSTKNKLEVKFYNKAEWDELWESVKKSEEKTKTKIFRDEFESSGAENIKNDYIGASDKIEEVSNIEELKKKVKEYTSKNSKIHYFVKELKVYLNNDNIHKNVTIVDTPGLDDVVDYRSKITKDYIKRANAIIVCVDSSSLRNDEYLTITKVFENIGDDFYKVMILGTQIDNKNNPKEAWEKQIEEWKKYLRDNYKNEDLLKNNIIGVSSYVYSKVIELENGKECDEDGKIAIYKLAKSYGIGLKDWQDSNLIIKNSENIKDLTNIKKVNSIMHRDIISKGEEEVIKDLEKRYLSMITNISNKAKSIKNTNSESKKTLDMTKAEQENFRIKKNKEIEEIEKAMEGLNEAFENIKTEWLNQNKKLKEAIKK
ncbi:dynamin family protein [Brachyspira aalborgi]|uniref:dynamin family protein n=1 Tax=Brachyspira aalborgi TaxID=29522 RepID=UPI0026651701|nr:dynamin family protein [Brachyspira aalborgi]